MIDKVKEWFYSKYGIEVEAKHVWMFLILGFSVILLVSSLLLNAKPKGNIDSEEPPTPPGIY